MEIVCFRARARMTRHVNDAIVRVLIVDVPHTVVAIVAVATLTLIGIRLDVHIATAAATIVMALGVPAIGSVAVSAVRVVRLTSGVSMHLLTHTGSSAAGVGHRLLYVRVRARYGQRVGTGVLVQPHRVVDRKLAAQNELQCAGHLFVHIRWHRNQRRRRRLVLAILHLAGRQMQ